MIPASLMNLTEAIHSLPDATRAYLAPYLDAVIEDSCRRRRILALVHEALDQLLLDTNYLMFDLEATRRERDALERRLNP